jgi:hypothetical protein
LSLFPPVQNVGGQSPPYRSAIDHRDPTPCFARDGPPVQRKEAERYCSRAVAQKRGKVPHAAPLNECPVPFEVQEDERFICQAEETTALLLFGVSQGGLGLEGGRRAKRVLDAAAGSDGQDPDRVAFVVKEAHGHADGIEVVGVRPEGQDPAGGGNAGRPY